MNIEIKFYEPWMKEQIIDLICFQYNRSKPKFQKRFNTFYESSFQSKSIKVVALDNDKVISFNSFIYWPYNFKDKTYNSFQSGGSIVDQNYRGKGVFQKMLNFMSENSEVMKIDFITGFPIDVSFGSLIRNGWTNPFNLQWYIKLNNIFSFLHSKKLKSLSEIFPEKKKIISDEKNKNIRLNFSQDFVKWREDYYHDEKYYISYTENDNTIQFGLKLNIRKKIINELIIGEINSNDFSETFIKNAFNFLNKKIKKIKFITITSIAINSQSNHINETLMKKIKFKKIDKEIYFLTKTFSDLPEFKNSKNWEIYRGDIDTW